MKKRVLIAALMLMLGLSLGWILSPEASDPCAPGAASIFSAPGGIFSWQHATPQSNGLPKTTEKLRQLDELYGEPYRR